MLQKPMTGRSACHDVPGASEFSGMRGGSRLEMKSRNCSEINTVAVAAPVVGASAQASDVSKADAPSAPGKLDRLLYTIGDVQRLLSLSRSTIYRCISENKLDARKIGGRSVITAASVESFVKKLPKAGWMPR